jgi:hypothetical protein
MITTPDVSGEPGQAPYVDLLGGAHTSVFWIVERAMTRPGESGD